MGSNGTVVILAAGKGTRMRSRLPKVLHPLCGRAMLGYVLDQARHLDPERILLVLGHGREEVQAWVEAEEADERIRFVVQEPQLGTGHALQQCLGELGAGQGPVTVLYGDMPLLETATLERLTGALEGMGAVLLTARPAKPRGFGRIVRGEDGRFDRIVEEKDASDEERAITEVNTGVYVFARQALVELLPRLENQNAQGEYYLTDVLGLLCRLGHGVVTVELEDETEAVGVNGIAHLSEARAVLQERILEGHMARGVFIEDPATTYIDYGVEIGAGSHVLPCTVIRGGVRVGEGCEVGPFTHLRVGTVLEDGAEVGNFTEAKKSRVGKGTKAKHLTYLGDVEIGAGANIGAGTIVANYDGKLKHRTTIGDQAFIGSGSVLIAPCKVGKGALTGGGAVVTRGSEIPDGEVWVGVPARSLRGGKGTGGGNS